MEQENDSSIDKDCYGIIVDQPIYFGKVDIKVSEMEGDATVVYEGRSIVVLDIECLALYPVVNNKLGTPYRLMFWQDEGPQSVEKILHYHKEQKIAFSTTSHTFEMVCYYLLWMLGYFHAFVVVCCLVPKKCVWSRNTTITNCRQTHGTARKSHTTITRHQEDKQSKATCSLVPIKIIT